MIKILNKNKELQAMIKDSYDPWRFEEINGENKLSFNATLTEKVSNYVNENNMVELEDDYFDIAYYSKNMNEDGTCTMAVECEHISYRLNDPMYDVDYFTVTGTPSHILSKISEGTGFTVGNVESTANITYSAQEKKSRRQLLMEFVALLGGEIEFNKFNISILNRRGSTDVKIFTKGKNIKVISKVYNGREDVPVFAYTCTPIILPDEEIGLGDDILLIQPELDIEDTLRVVRYGYNPYEKMEAEIEIANYINGLEDQLYRIETSTVAKEKIYNGCRIGPEEGFVAERSDNKVKTTMNATEGIKIESDLDGAGLNKVFFVDTEGKIIAKGIEIEGEIVGNTSIDITNYATIGNVLSIGHGTAPTQTILFRGGTNTGIIQFKGETSELSANANNVIIGLSADNISIGGSYANGALAGNWELNGDTIATLGDIGESGISANDALILINAVLDSRNYVTASEAHTDAFQVATDVINSHINEYHA